jgi:hypothetical protein
MFVQHLKNYEDYTPEGEPLLDTFAEVQQRWHLWRRRYDLFLKCVCGWFFWLYPGVNASQETRLNR